MAKRIQLRRGVAVDWVLSNPILAIGEPGFETDTNKLKIGDGSTEWNSLSYFEVESIPVIPSGSICQIYDSTGGIPCNSGQEIPFDAENFKDSNYEHSNTVDPEQLGVKSPGIYKVYYNISHINQTSSRKNVRSFCVINGITFIAQSISYSYSRNTNDAHASNSAQFFISLNNGDYITIVCEQAGSSGSALSEAESSWLMIEKIRDI